MWIGLEDLTSFLESEGSGLHLSRGSEQSPTVSKTDTHKVFFCPECDQVTLIKRRSGTMCELCTVLHLSQNQISSSGDSPARISALPEMVQAWAESGRDFSLKSSDYVAIFDQDSFSWKTSQLSLFGGLTEFVWNSLRSGMIVGGRLCQPPQLEPFISENDGSYLPTPTACDYGKNVGRKSDGITPSGRDRWSLTVRARRGELPGHPKGSLNPEWIEQAMGFPSAWTAIDASATAWFRSKREKRLKNYVA